MKKSGVYNNVTTCLINKVQKEQLVRTIEQEAHDSEVMYWGCGQAVLDALQRNLNLGDGEAFKAASAVGGGIGGMREACGALMGAVMAIGLAYGRRKFETGKVSLEQPDSVEAKLRASRFCERFKEEFGGLRCNDVRASVREPSFNGSAVYSYNTVEAFEDHAKCGDVTGPTARLAAEIILQPTELFADEINACLEGLRQVREQQKEI